VREKEEYKEPEGAKRARVDLKRQRARNRMAFRPGG